MSNINPDVICPDLQRQIDELKAALAQFRAVYETEIRVLQKEILLLRDIIKPDFGDTNTEPAEETATEVVVKEENESEE